MAEPGTCFQASSPLGYSQDPDSSFTGVGHTPHRTLHRGTGYGNLASLFVCYEVGGTAKLCTRPTSTALNVTAAENCGHSLKEPNNSGLEITRHLLQGSAAPRGTGMWASGGSSMAHSPILIAVVPGGGRTRIMGPWAASKHQKCDDHHNCTAGDF